MTWSSQSRVTRTVGSLQVIGLQSQVNVESNKILHFFYEFSYAMKQRQHAINWRTISENMVTSVVLTSLIAGYLNLSFSV